MIEQKFYAFPKGKYDYRKNSDSLNLNQIDDRGNLFFVNDFVQLFSILEAYLYFRGWHFLQLFVSIRFNTYPFIPLLN